MKNDEVTGEIEEAADVIRANAEPARTPTDGFCQCELLLLPNGQVLVHNMTPAMARLLREIDPVTLAGRDIES